MRKKNKPRDGILTALDTQIGTYNIVGPFGGFRKDGAYSVTWLVDGKSSTPMYMVLTKDCIHPHSPREWFDTYIKTMMFTFNIPHADIIVTEVKNDLPKML